MMPRKTRTLIDIESDLDRMREFAARVKTAKAAAAVHHLERERAELVTRSSARVQRAMRAGRNHPNRKVSD